MSRRPVANRLFEREQPRAQLGLIAALYARKSNEQRHVAVQQTSVVTQIAEGTEFAARHAWPIADGCIYSDDGISGAEFNARPAFSRMMALARSGRAPFNVIIVRDLSRVGREPIEAMMHLKWLDQANIQVWTYQDDQFIDLRDEIKVMMLIIQAFGAGQQRVATSKNVLAAMIRKARAGHVISVLPYGYAGAPVMINGKRSHVERQIVTAEAVVVLRIYEEYARGAGTGTIAKGLTRDGIRPRRGARWSTTTVAGILSNPMYRGEIIAHRYVYTDHWGQKNGTSERPPAEWIRVDSPADRIVPDALWYAAEQRRQRNLSDREAALAAGKRVGGTPARDCESEYLLTGNAICELCEGPMCVIRRDVAANGRLASKDAPGSTRYPFYRCQNYHRNGQAGCANATSVRLDRLEAEVLDAIRQRLGKPGLVEKMIAEALRRRSSSATAAKAARLTKAIAKGARDCAQLRAALLHAKRTALESVVADLEDRELELNALRRQLAAVQGAAATESTAALVTRARAKLEGWHDLLLGSDIAETRKWLREVLSGKIVITPAAGAVAGKYARNQYGPRKDTRAVTFAGRFSMLPLLAPGFAGQARELSPSDPSGMASALTWEREFTGRAA